MEEPIKSKYETLSDKSLFKFLKYLYNDTKEFLDENWNNSYDSEITNKVIDSLKKFGLELNDIDIDFFWVTLKLNSEEMSKFDTLEFEIKRPKVLKYVIDIKITGKKWYVEWGKQSMYAYSHGSAEGYTNSEDFSPWDSDFYDEDILDSQTDDWKVNSIEPVKNYNEMSEQNTIIKKLMKENFENVVSDYNMDELIQMRDIIDEKLKNRISFI
jgi:hypothetical protein